MARTPNSSLIEWMGIEDSAGVNIAHYHLMFRGSGIDIVAGVALVLVTIISLVMSVLLGIALGLSSLITSSNVLLQGVASFTQTILDAVHSVFNPLVIAFAAFVIVVSRQVLPNYVFGKDKFTSHAVSGIKNFKGVRIGGVDYSSGGQVDVRGFINVIFRGAVVMGVVLFLSVNPFAIIVRAMDFVGNIGNAIAGQSEGGALNYATSLYQALFSLINFGSIPDNCLDVYSRDMVEGTSNTWACLGQVESKAGFDHVMLSVLALVVAGTLAFFLWKAFLQGSLFLAYALWDFITVPYRMSWAMFKSDFDEDKRSIYDYVLNTISRLVVYFAFYLIIVFVMTSVPAIVIYAVSSVVTAVVGDGAAAAFLILIAISVCFYFGGRWVPLIYPRIDGDDRAHNWATFSTTIRENYNPLQRDDVTGRLAVSDTFKETVRENTVIKKVLGVAGVDPRAVALSEDQKTILGLAKESETDGFARRAVRDAKKAEAHLERDRRLLDKRVAAGKLTPEQASAAYDKLDKRAETLNKIIEAKAQHAQADSLEVVPAHLAGLPEFKGRLVAPASAIKAAEKAVARQEFEKLTGLSADDQDVWNNVDSVQANVRDKKRKLEEDRAAGVISRTAYEEQLAALNTQLAKADEVYQAKQDFERAGMVSMTEKVDNPYFDASFAALSSQDIAALPAQDIRFASRADERHITRAELAAIDRSLARARMENAFKESTGYAPGEDWDNAEKNLAAKKASLASLNQQVRVGDLTPDSAKKAQEALAKDIAELEKLGEAKRKFLEGSATVSVVDPRLVNEGVDTAKVAVSVLPDGRVPYTDSDVLYALASKKRNEVHDELREVTRPATEAIAALKGVDGDKDSQRKTARTAVAAAESLIPMSDAAGHEGSDFEQRVSEAQSLITTVIDNPDSSEDEVREATAAISAMLHAPAHGLVNDFINARSASAMLNEVNSVNEGFRQVHGSQVELPSDPHLAMPDVPATWIHDVDDEQLRARVAAATAALNADTGAGADAQAAVVMLREAAAEVKRSKVAEVNEKLATGTVDEGSVVVANVAGEPTEIPRSVKDRVEDKQIVWMSRESMQDFQQTMMAGDTGNFMDELRRRIEQTPFTIINAPVVEVTPQFTAMDATGESLRTMRSSVYEAARASDTVANSVSAVTQQQPRTASGEGTLVPPAEVDAAGTPTSASATYTGSSGVVDNVISESRHSVTMTDSINRDAAMGGSGATTVRVLEGGTLNADPRYLHFVMKDDGTAEAKRGVFRDLN